MFNSLKGTLTEKRFDAILLETGGLEWEISVSSRSLDEFGHIGSQIRAFVWLHHREDAMKLYGFPSESDRSLFFDLVKVEGIGPKQALKIMSGIASLDFEMAIESEDLARLQKVPGLGKKTAEKLVFALKGKIVRSEPERSGKTGAWDDVVKALSEMGYDRKSVIQAVEGIVKDMDIAHSGETEKDVFRRAIIALSS